MTSRTAASVSRAARAVASAAASRQLRTGVVLAVGLGLVGCEQESADERPEWVVAEFTTRLQRVHGDPRSARAAYELLWAEGRQNLAERAKRASAVTGQKIAPEEMLAPSRLWLRARPRRFSARISGGWAEVEITTDATDGRSRHVVRCVEEDGRWRVALPLPQLPPIERRIEPR